MAKKIVPPAAAFTFTEADGRDLAANLLHDLRVTTWAASEACAGDGTVDLQALAGQCAEVLKRYLVRARHDPELEAGLLYVLGDILACVVDGCVPTIEHYEGGALDGDREAA